jgi:hypothetical protein
MQSQQPPKLLGKVQQGMGNTHWPALPFFDATDEIASYRHSDYRLREFTKTGYSVQGQYKPGPSKVRPLNAVEKAQQDCGDSKDEQAMAAKRAFMARKVFSPHAVCAGSWSSSSSMAAVSTKEEKPKSAVDQVKADLNDEHPKNAYNNTMSDHKKEMIISKTLETEEGRQALANAMMEPIRDQLEYRATLPNVFKKLSKSKKPVKKSAVKPEAVQAINRRGRQELSEEIKYTAMQNESLARHLDKLKTVKIKDDNRPATKEEIADMQEQMKQVANDPNMTITTAGHFALNWEPVIAHLKPKKAK